MLTLDAAGADPRSYRQIQPDRTSALRGAQPSDFTIADLLRFAGVV